MAQSSTVNSIANVVEEREVVEFDWIEGVGFRPVRNLVEPTIFRDLDKWLRAANVKPPLQAVPFCRAGDRYDRRGVLHEGVDHYAGDANVLIYAIRDENDVVSAVNVLPKRYLRSDAPLSHGAALVLGKEPAEVRDIIRRRNFDKLIPLVNPRPDCLGTIEVKPPTPEEEAVDLPESLDVLSEMWLEWTPERHFDDKAEAAYEARMQPTVPARPPEELRKRQEGLANSAVPELRKYAKLD